MKHKAIFVLAASLVASTGCSTRRDQHLVLDTREAGLTGAARESGTSKIERNKATLVRAHRDVWSQGTLDLIETLYDKNYVCHFAGGYEWRGIEGFKSNLRDWRLKFPDWLETVEEMVAEGDFVVTRFTSTGTHSGSGAPDLAGKKVSIMEIAVHRLVDGKITEQWGLWDYESLKKQLGQRPDF